MSSMLASWRETLSQMLTVLTPKVLALFLCLLCVVGIGSAYGGRAVIMALLAIPVVALAVTFPPALLVLYLNVGIFKADPQLRALVGGFDLTALAAAVLVGMCAYRLLLERGTLVWSKEVSLAFVFVCIVLVSLIYAPATSYGRSKAINFASLTLLAFISPLVLVQSARDARVLLWAWLIMGSVMTVSILSQPHTQERVSAFGASEIGVSRTIGVSLLTTLFVLILGNYRLLPKLLGVGMVFAQLIAMLSTGSRGPLLFVIGAILITLAVSTSIEGHRKRSLVVAIGGAAIVVVSLASLSSLIPRRALERFEVLADDPEGGDTSTLARRLVWADAKTMFADNLLIGAGAGAVSNYGAGRDQLYPHNMILEVGAEQGLLGLGVMLTFLALVFHRLLRVLLLPEARTLADVPVQLGILSALIYNLLGGMVSGDLNAGRDMWALAGMAIAMSVPASQRQADNAEGG